jgi:hypothetical protein
VQVHYNEGVATHIGPESCGYDREVMREALTGERAGQPLSCEILLNSGADVIGFRGRQHGQMRHASIGPTRRSPRPWHARKFSAREPGGLVDRPAQQSRLARIGKASRRSR